MVGDNMGQSKIKTHNLEIVADNRATILERVLQVTRYRGFIVTSFNVSLDIESDQFTMQLTINDPTETPELPLAGVHRLYHQLNKLFDIKHVNLAAEDKL